MRIYLVVAVVGLLIVEALLLPRTVKDLRLMRQMRNQAASEALLPTSLTSFAGYDVEGRPLTLVAKDAKWIVPVVLHSTRMASDLDYLRGLRKAITSHEVAILGVCDSNRCGGGLPAGQALPDVPILAYGSYVPLMEIGYYDERNQVMLLDSHWTMKQLLRKQSSAEEMAAEIQNASGK